MNPERAWHTLSPQEQAAWRAHYTQQQQPAAPTVNVWAIIAVISAVIGALLGFAGMPLALILFGPIALICGIVGEQIATRRGGPGRWWSAAALLIGLGETGMIVMALM